jgi:hypothetical protein
MVRALGSVLAGLAKLGTRVLRTLERSLYPDIESELVDGDESGYVYGITKPAAGDKTYIDPLSEWDVCKVTYYQDSFGRRIYPQLSTDGTRVNVFAAEYRDLSEDERDELRGQAGQSPLSFDVEGISDNSSRDSDIDTNGSERDIYGNDPRIYRRTSGTSSSSPPPQPPRP